MLIRAEGSARKEAPTGRELRVPDYLERRARDGHILVRPLAQDLRVNLLAANNRLMVSTSPSRRAEATSLDLVLYHLVGEDADLGPRGARGRKPPTGRELVKQAAGLLQPVLHELIRQAAQGSVMHNDDTGMRILRLARNTDDGRTGTFTSGIVAVIREWKIALYFTGWKHAGENLADVLKQSTSDSESPIQMCDALSRNAPRLSGVQILLAYCLSHGKRQSVDIAPNFP